MGAALHLAVATHTPPKPRGPRTKGKGGSGDGYDAFIQRIYADTRHTPESRELLLLIAWLRHRDPKRHDGGTMWERATPILGADGKRGTLDRPRLAVLINADRPRYELARSAWADQSCAAPMIRREGLCGNNATEHTLRVDPDTGWHTPVWWCSRHREFGRKAEAVFRAGPRPDPIPNRGGLMPSYLRAKDGDAAWIRLYTWASGWCHSRWEPPKGYGLVADGWPVPGMVPPVDAPRLRLAAVDGELLAGPGQA